MLIVEVASIAKEGIAMSLHNFLPISAFLLLLVLYQAPSALATLSWESSGPGGGGALASPSMSKKGSIIIGSDLGGAYRSTNGGALWSAIGLNHGLLSTHVDATAFHPTIDGIVFLGTGNGIYKSKNCDTSPAGPCNFTGQSLRAFSLPWLWPILVDLPRPPFTLLK